MSKSNKSKKDIVIRCFLNVVIVCLISLLVLKYVFIWGDVPTISMYPTILAGDRVGIVKITGVVERGDIIVFDTPKELLAITDAKYLCKRVIATEGEMVEIIGGKVYVDDKMLDESSYIVNNDYTMNMYKMEVPINSLFVLGDNRTNSYDSRYWDKKFIKTESIIGVVPFKINELIEKPKYN